MSSAISQAPASLAAPPAVAAKLTGLRRAVNVWLWLDGLRRLLVWVVGLVVADLAIDWYFRMDWDQRLVVLIFSGITLAVVAYRRLYKPLSKSIDDDTLCLRVEGRNRELGESLISAVQFARGYDAERLGVSPSMVQATIDRGTAASASVNFNKVLDDRTATRNLLIVAGALLLLAAFGVSIAMAQPSASRIWFERNILLGDAEWPQDTYFVIHGVDDQGVLRVPRGDDFTQLVDIREDSVVPQIVFLDYKPQGWGSRVTEQMAKTGERNFRSTFKNVLDEFQFRVHGGDAYSRWITVKLVERPTVDDLELTLTPPAYTGLKPEPLPAGKGPYYVLKGSKLQIAGTASKPLAEVRLLIGDRRYTPVTINQAQFTASVDAAALLPQTYSIELTDSEKWESKRPSRFSLKTRLDREPSIKARLEGISSMIVPGARLPINCTIQDDFAVADVKLVWQAKSDTSEDLGTSGEVEFAELKPKLGQPKLQHLFTLATESWQLQTASTLTFHLEARDNDNISGPKVGKSDQFVLKVVTEEELRADLLRREREQRLEVERLLKDQEDMLTDSRAILATVEEKPDMPDDQRQLLVKTQKKQNLASDRAKGVATFMVAVIAEVQNNNLEEVGGPIQRRLLDQVIEPLTSIANEMVPQAANLLDTARRAAAKAEPRDKALASAAEQQEKIALSLREILKVMAKAEGYQEAVNLLYAILKSQNELNDNTLKEGLRKIDELFRDESDKKNVKPPSPQETPAPANAAPAAGAASAPSSDKPAGDKPAE